jgi:hypothetical protein
MKYVPQTDGIINIDGEALKKATQFRYLGFVVSSDGDNLPDVRTRANVTWMKGLEVTGVLCDRRMPNQRKAKVNKTVVRPVTLYRSECSPTILNHKQTLHTMELRML